MEYYLVNNTVKQLIQIHSGLAFFTDDPDHPWPVSLCKRLKIVRDQYGRLFAQLPEAARLPRVNEWSVDRHGIVTTERMVSPIAVQIPIQAFPGELVMLGHGVGRLKSGLVDNGYVWVDDINGLNLGKWPISQVRRFYPYNEKFAFTGDVMTPRRGDWFLYAGQDKVKQATSNWSGSLGAMDMRDILIPFRLDHFYRSTINTPQGVRLVTKFRIGTASYCHSIALDGEIFLHPSQRGQPDFGQPLIDRQCGKPAATEKTNVQGDKSMQKLIEKVDSLAALVEAFIKKAHPNHKQFSFIPLDATADIDASEAIRLDGVEALAKLTGRGVESLYRQKLTALERQLDLAIADERQARGIVDLPTYIQNHVRHESMISDWRIDMPFPICSLKPETLRAVRLFELAQLLCRPQDMSLAGAVWRLGKYMRDQIDPNWHLSTKLPICLLYDTDPVIVNCVQKIRDCGQRLKVTGYMADDERNGIRAWVSISQISPSPKFNNVLVKHRKNRRNADFLFTFMDDPDVEEGVAEIEREFRQRLAGGRLHDLPLQSIIEEIHRQYVSTAWTTGREQTVFDHISPFNTGNRWFEHLTTAQWLLWIKSMIPKRVTFSQSMPGFIVAIDIEAYKAVVGEPKPAMPYNKKTPAATWFEEVLHKYPDRNLGEIHRMTSDEALSEYIGWLVYREHQAFINQSNRVEKWMAKFPRVERIRSVANLLQEIIEGVANGHRIFAWKKLCKEDRQLILETLRKNGYECASGGDEVVISI